MERRIRNFDALAQHQIGFGAGRATDELRVDALSIAEAGYAAVDTAAALTRALCVEGEELHLDGETYRLAGRRIFFVGVGKCAFAAAAAVEKLLGDRLTGGVALDVSPVVGDAPKKVETYIGTHPLPTEVNETATKRIMEFLSDCLENDLVLMLISGGGSTLLCLHQASMTCYDESVLYQELTAKGAPIRDINTVRKHISRARGGALARAAYPAEVVSLIVSDVPGNDLATVASGPTMLDTSTVADARVVLETYGVTAAANIEFLETPKEAKYFECVTNLLFLSSQDALVAMRSEATRRGYAVTVEDKHFSGEAKEVGRAITEKLHATPAKTALLYAGESTVTLTGPHGAGGRNQDLALAALADIRADELVLPLASDGRDNTEYAGAIADAETLSHAASYNISAEKYLETHRSYDFFAATGDALLTGYTGSNVSDLIIALKR